MVEHVEKSGFTNISRDHLLETTNVNAATIHPVVIMMISQDEWKLNQNEFGESPK